MNLRTIFQRIVITVTGDKEAAVKAEALGKNLDDVGDKAKVAGKATEDYGTKTRKTTKDVDAGTTAVRKAGAETEKLGRTLKGTSKDHNTLSNAIARNRRESDGLTEAVKDLRNGMRTAGQVAGVLGAFLGLVKFPGLVAGAELATSALSSLTAGAIALIGTLGPLVNLIGLLPAALAGAAGGIGAVLIGTRGIGDALGAGFAKKAPTGGATKDPVDEARKLADAQRQVARSAETLADSQRDVERAQEDVNKAYLEARENLRDLREEQTRGTNSVARAEIALARAQENNAKLQEDSTATALDKREALIDVSDAELDLLDAQERRTKNARDLFEAERKGVDQSDGVRDATERLSDAQQAVIDNQEELRRAIEDTTRTQQTGAVAADKFGDSMKDLGPQAQQFVRTILGQQSLFKSVKRDVQDSLFGPINEGLGGVIKNAPFFRAFLVSSAAGIGELARKAEEAFGDEGFGKDLATLGEGNRSIFARIGDGIKSVISLFRDLAVVGQPFVKQIVDLAVNGLGKFADNIRRLRENGGLADAFQAGLDRAKEFGNIFRDLFVGIRNVFRASSGLGDDLLESLGNLIKRFRDFTESFHGQVELAEFFGRARGPIHEVALLIRDIVKMFGELSKANTGVLVDALQQIRTEGLPILQRLFDAVGPHFVEQVLNLAGAFGNLFAALFGESSALGIFLETMAGIFNVIGDILDKTPLLKDFVIALVTFGSAVKVLSLLGKASGLTALANFISQVTTGHKLGKPTDFITGLVKGFRDARTEAKLTSAVIVETEAASAASASASAGAQTAKVVALEAEGAAAAGAAGGVTTLAAAEEGAAAAGAGLMATLGPMIAITAAIAIGAFAVTKAWGAWHKRGRELKATINDVRDALKDEETSVEDAIKSAADKRIADKHQNDDLIRIGITTRDITKASIEGGDALEDLRRKAVDAGEIKFTGIGADLPGVLARAREEFIKTGRVGDGLIISNQGLADSINDIAKAADEAARLEIESGRATGQFSDALEGAAIAADIADQGLLGFLGTGRRYAFELDHIKDAQERSNAALQTAIDLQKKRSEGILRGVGDRNQRDRDQRAAVQAAGALSAAQQKVAAFQLAGKGDTQEAKDAQEELTRAQEEAEDAALRFAEANVAVAQSQAEMEGKTVSATEVLQIQKDSLNSLLTFTNPSGEFRTQLQGTIDQLNEALTDRTLTVTVQMPPNADWLNQLTNAIKGATQAGITGGLALGAPGAVIAPPTAKPIAQVTIKSKNAFKEAGGIIGLAAGGLMSVGHGFMTNGPLAVVGEGKRQFPEFVVPTDPEHRKNAWALLYDLVRRLGVPQFAGGGTLGGASFGFDAEGIKKAVLGFNARELVARNVHAAELALANQIFQSAHVAGGGNFVTSADTVNHIGQSVGNEWNFEEGAIVVKGEWSDVKAGIERERALRNLTRARAARSIK